MVTVERLVRLGAALCLAALIALPLAFIPDTTPAEQVRREKSKRMANPQGYPDLFAQYHRDIRTRAGAAAPEYPLNYQMTELQRTRALRKGPAEQLPWVERGPGNISGRTRAILVDPDDPNHHTWLIGSVGGGIWKTTDAGDSWTNITPDWPNLAISAMAQGVHDPNFIYAGTGEGFFNLDAIAGAGIFRSVDRGATWYQLPATANDPNFRFVNRIVLNPEDASHVIAVTNTGIYTTFDGGSSWVESYASQGRVQDLVRHPNNGFKLYAAENSIGVLKSTDGGLTWERAATLPDFHQRVELAIPPSHPHWIYAAVQVNPATTNGSDRSFLYLSRDEGESWTLVSELFASSWLGGQGWYDNAVAVHPYDPDIVFHGGINLFRSNPSGTPSQELVVGVQELGTPEFLTFVNFGAPFLQGGLEIGSNEGATSITEDEYVSVELRFGPGLQQKAHRYTPPDGPGIALTTYPYADYVDVPFEVWDVTNNVQLMVSFRDRSADGAFNLIERDEANLGREYLFVHNVPYSETADPTLAQNGGVPHRLMYFIWPLLENGGTWNPDNLPESTLRLNLRPQQVGRRTTTATDTGVHVDHHNLTIIPVDEGTGDFKILNGNDGGVYFSEDGGASWKNTENGLNTSQFYGVDKKPGEQRYIGGMQDNGTARSALANPSANTRWDAVLGGDGFETVWNQANSNWVLGSIQWNNIQFSPNGGLSWVGVNGLGDSGSGSGGQFLTQIANSADAPDHVFTVGASGVWRSTDFGQNWSAATMNGGSWASSGQARVEVSEADPNVVWAGYRLTDASGILHVSTDQGLTFNPVTAPAIAPGRISGIGTHPTDGNTAYALFSVFNGPKILRTTDLGATWEDITGYSDGSTATGFPNVAVYDLLVGPNKQGELWAATEIGLYVSKDDGQTWRYADNGLPAVAIWQLRLRDGEILAATHGRGIWTVPVQDFVTSDEPDAAAGLPTTFDLEQNYPNPFNPSTTIRFALPQAEHVRLTVYDVAGRQVATVANQRYRAGRHAVTWDAGTLASGTYLYRLEAGSFVQTKTLTLVK